MKRLLAAMTAAMMMVAITLIASGAAMAAVQTDRWSYVVGDTVQITGDGMVAGEAVTVDVAYPDATLAQEHVVVADANGDFADSYIVTDSDPAGVYAVSATGQSSGNVFETTFDPSNTENGAFATTGLPSGASVAVTYSGLNPGGNAQSSSRTFNAPGPSAIVGFQGDSILQCTFPASITANGNIYDLAAQPCGASGTTLPAASSPTHTSTFTGAYTLRVASNVAPLIAWTAHPASTDEGQTETYSFLISDSDSSSWSFVSGYPDCGTGGSISGTPSIDSTAKTGTFDCLFPDGPASPTVRVKVSDGTAASNELTQVVSVANVAPTTAFTTAPATADEGQTKTYRFSVSDPGADTYTATYDCGTGGSYVASSFTSTGDSGSQTGSFQCSFPDGPASPTVSIYFTDSDGLAGTEATQKVTVANVKPTPTIDSLSGNSGVACIAGNTVTLGFSWTDSAQTNDTYSYDVAWGDGTHTQSSGFPTAGLAYGDSPVSGLTHTYSAGTYTISVTVNDSDPGAGATITSDSFSFLYSATGVLQPVNDTQAHQNPSIFKYGSTIPVKIEVTDCDGTPVSGLSPKIAVQKMTSSTPSGIDEAITSTSGADTGTTMRWSDPLYIYNLATKSLADSSATYQITITGPFADVTTLFGTKAK